MKKVNLIKNGQKKAKKSTYYIGQHFSLEGGGDYLLAEVSRAKGKSKVGFISLNTGKLMTDFDGARPKSKQYIESVKVKDVNNITEQELLQIDDQRHFKLKDIEMQKVDNIPKGIEQVLEKAESLERRFNNLESWVHGLVFNTPVDGKQRGETYNIGDQFEDQNGNEYILACVDGNKQRVALIGLEDGNRFVDPVEVEDLNRITKEDLFGSYEAKKAIRCGWEFHRTWTKKVKR